MGDRLLAIVVPLGYVLAGTLLREVGQALVMLSEVLLKTAG